MAPAHQPDGSIDRPRLEYRVIADLVRRGTSVLDLGCGKGELLSLLTEERVVKGQGIEIDEHAIYSCVARGLSVFHGDIDIGLSEYGDRSFDYVILSQSLQQVRKPDAVLEEALRVGKQVIVSFPNFAHCSVRLKIFFRGRTAVTPSLHYRWFDTPNLHFLSISDFIDYCEERAIRVNESAFLSRDAKVRFRPNLFAQIGIFLISR